MAKPVFPPDIPSFHQHLVESMLSSKVYVFFYVLIISRVLSVGLDLVIIRFS